MKSSFEGGSLSQLFATPVWTFVPHGGKALAVRLGAHLRGLRDGDPKWKAGGEKGVWQSRDDLHLAPELAELVALVDEANRAALSLLRVSASLHVTGLWGNVSRGAESLHDHTHPNNYLSGVFYVEMPDGAGAIAFKDPRPQTRALRPRTLEDTPLNSLEFEYTPKTGTLVLFPAWLEHGVRPSRGDAERITLAWNSMVRGPMGSHETLSYSEI